MPYIEVEGLTFKYDREPVLDDVNMIVDAGEFVMLTGENGAAKSTLIRNILGILEPNQGTVRLAKKTKEGSSLLIGYIPQIVSQFNAGFPSTVSELTQSGTYPRGKWFKPVDDEDRGKVDWALNLVGMTEYRDTAIGELSGGQKQRLSIARVLAMDPDLYILDEPTTGMDHESRHILYDFLKKETSLSNKSVLMVTHEQDELQMVADRHLKLVRKAGTQWRCFTMIS
ncbi:MAG: metal ABC transporter ATP-binding protein [Atopococcus tabaci]|uniref:Metal ABC transporter ATP-binding protein n=1 Tax=Atopococcus tabaci TaxID=269774 RepID=A0AA43ZRW3_9LACT|nr:metal ABC transporter ATP-binding protein [Atopococcus tabaci]